MNKLQTYLLPLLLFPTFFAASPSFSEDTPPVKTEVATVDIFRILNELGESKAAKGKLEKVSQSAKATVQQKQIALKKLEEKITAKKLEEDSPEVEEFREKALELKRFVRDTDEDIKREFLKVNKELSERALQAIKKYAEKHNIDLVLDMSEARQGPILFRDKSFDITDEILKILNG